MTETVHGIEYSKPTVILLQETGIGTAEAAARTCYDSFEASENDAIKEMLKYEADSQMLPSDIDNINAIGHSDLLDQLAWTHFHYSILEHASMTYLIKGTSRGVLQELSRHRIASYSVRSTRYTGSSILNAFVASQNAPDPRTWFANTLLALNMFVTSEHSYNRIECEGIYSKLYHQRHVLGVEEFNSLAIAKSSIALISPHVTANTLFEQLQAGKNKRNALDPFKNIVTDTWKVDLVMTINLRSFKNFLQLRDSGAAYFGIQWLSAEMIKATPRKYLDLILKQDQINKHLS